MKKFKPCHREQLLLLPQNMYDWLPGDHIARFILEAVQELDLTAFYAAYSSRGGPRPYDAEMMVALLLYGYCVDVRSSRKIERATWTDVAFRVIAANQHPDHDTIAEFRKRHAGRLTGLFVQVLAMSKRAGLLQMRHVSIDGTRIRANASHRKRLSEGELTDEESKLIKEVEKYFKECGEVDECEDELYGKGKRGDELPEHLRTREGRLRALREAKAALEEEKRKKEAEKKGESSCNEKSKDQKEKDKVWRVNTTDPDSRMMRMNTNIFNECYNAQIVVDHSSQVIVAESVVQNGNDRTLLVPMLQKAKENTGGLPQFASADCGYFNNKAISHAELKNTQLIIPAPRTEPGWKLKVHTKRMQEFLASRAGRRLYGRRKTTVEPVFGQFKQNRGFRQFVMRGLQKVQCEWSLMCMTHNLLKIFQYAR